jgi:rhamnogalacturonyl hydrolase YesR
MNFRRSTYILVIITSMLLAACSAPRKLQRQLGTSKEEVVAIIHKVNGYWQSNHPPAQRAFWDVAAYHTGNMEAYAITGNQDYRKYSEAWGEHNQWMGAKSTNKAEWKYKYGETDDHVLFGDWQICFQTYIDLYNIHKDEKKIARAKEVMEYEMSTPQNDYWWWVDGLYMVMPVMTKLYKITGNKLYLDKLYEYWRYANSIMYDNDTKLYYRDAKYVYPQHKSANGMKDFWARGDGWVFAGFAKVLQDLPADYEHRDEFIIKYKGIAEAIKKAQQPEGYWTRSILDPAHAPGPETSGTAFFTYGLLWGINNGYLGKEEYLPVVVKSWNYLTNVALQPDGKIGYVQPIGERAIPGQVVNQNSTSNFGVGAFLLAACEMVRLLDSDGKIKKADTPPAIAETFRPGKPWLDTNGELINAHGGGILYAGNKYYWFGEKRGRFTSEGVNVYSSTDLYNWKHEALALSPVDDSTHDIARGCVVERPKVIFNPKTGKYVMWFHLELRGKGYSAARAAVAVSDKVTGPYQFVHSFRPNENMSRDMTLYADDNGSAYHIYSSRENYDLRLVKLTDDFLSPTAEDRMLFSSHREAPAIFKYQQTYYLITSGCTGWKPNKATIHTATSIWGPWTLQEYNSMRGAGADTTYGGQSTFVVPVQGKKDAFIFMADRWNPHNLRESRYLWLPVLLNNGQPVAEWRDEWSLNVFTNKE